VLDSASEETPETALVDPDALEGEPAASISMRPDDQDDTERSNLAGSMSPEMCKVIATKVRDRYDRDLASRSDRMKRLKDIQEAYALVPKPKNFPFHKAANVRTPTLTGPNLQIQARLYDMVWPASGKVFYVVPGTAEDQMVARLSEMFANSYVRYRMPYMAQGLDDTLHQTCLYGSGFRRTYWDAYFRKVRSDWVPMEDFVVSYKQRSQDPSMSDVPRYTFRHWMTRSELLEYGADGIFINTKEIPAATDGDPQRSEFQEAANKIDGHGDSDELPDDDTPRPVLEQHCRWKLPNQQGKHPAFNGKSRYVVILIDAWSGQLLRLSLREEDDPDDRRRWERQQQAYVQYQDQLRTWVAAQLAPPPPMLPGMPPEVGALPPGVPAGDSPGSGLPPGAAAPPPPMDIAGPPMPGGPPSMTAPPMPGGPPDTTLPPAVAGAPSDVAAPMLPPGTASPGPAPLPQFAAPPIQKPDPVPEPAPIRKRQICFFTHYRCFPSDGFYGLGYGDLLFGLSKAEDTLLNQHIDGVTLKNAKPMFMSRQLRMQRGQINVQPGEAIEVDAPMGSIRDAIMWLDPPENDPTTVPLVNLLDRMKDSMVGSSDLMSGQIPGSNQTKGGLQILAEQAMAPITVLARRIKEAFRHELEKIWRCWGVFLDDDEIADVVAEGGVSEQIHVGKWMFSPTAHLIPASDPRMKSQRVDDHMALVQYVTQNPIVMNNPQVGMPVLSKLLEEGLRIFPDGEKLLPMLQQRQPQPPPPQPKPQWAENAGFLNGQDSPVLPPDNDDQHIDELLQFMQGPDAQTMDKTGRDMAERHLRAHVAQRLSKRGAQFGTGNIPPGATGPGPGPGQGIPGPGPGGPPGMAGPPPQPPPAPPPGIQAGAAP
jgi:hypothetical protein